MRAHTSTRPEIHSVALSDLILDAQPGFASGKNEANGIMQVRMNNVGTDGSLNWDKIRRVPASDMQLRNYALQAGDVLFNATNSPNLVGKSAFFAGHNEPVVFSNHFMRLRSDQKRLHPQYLSRWLTYLRERHVFEGLCIQWVNQATVRKEDLLSLRIPLPTLAEQQRIASILDKADALHRKRAETLRLADDLLKSAFLDMFGDPVTNPKGWSTDLFGNVGELDRGRSRHRPRNAPELLGGPYPLIQTGDIANSGGYIRSYTQTYSELGLAQSKMWPVGTLCITIAANIAKTAILSIEACFPDSVVGFIPNGRVRTEYIQYWLSFLQKILEETAPESAQKNINLEILRTLEVPVPPPSLQEDFVRLVQKTELSKDKMRNSMRGNNVLFASLTQCAFRGEL